MLFSLKPKENRNELFGRNREVDELKHLIARKSTIVVMTGIKRIGKTSILLTALNELKYPSLVLDLRRMDEEGYAKSVMFKHFAAGLGKNVSKWHKLGDYLKGVKGVNVLGNGVEFDWGKNTPSLTDVLVKMNEWVAAERPGEKFVVAIDEAQLLRFLTGGSGRIDFRMVMAHAYDYLENIKFILTGSEVGLLEDFLHPEEGADPLSGREIRTQKIERFNPGTAEKFLRAGFRETKKRVRSSEIELALKRFDGLVGWLVLYGSRVVEGETNPIDMTFADAKNTVLRDLKRATSESEYYKYALNAIAEGKNEFEQIRLYIGLKINRNFNPGSLGRIIERLKKLSIIKTEGGKVSFEDPVTLAAAVEL